MEHTTRIQIKNYGRRLVIALVCLLHVAYHNRFTKRCNMRLHLLKFVALCSVLSRRCIHFFHTFFINVICSLPVSHLLPSSTYLSEFQPNTLRGRPTKSFLLSCSLDQGRLQGGKMIVTPIKLKKSNSICETRLFT